MKLVNLLTVVSMLTLGIGGYNAAHSASSSSADIDSETQIKKQKHIL